MIHTYPYYPYSLYSLYHPRSSQRSRRLRSARARLTVAVMELMKDEKTPMAKRMTQTAKSLAGRADPGELEVKYFCWVNWS